MRAQAVRRVAGVVALVAGVVVVLFSSGCVSGQGVAGGKAPQYLVVALSGGTSATRYPVTYYATSNDLPCGVNSDPYKTTNLLMRLIPAGVFTMGSPSNEMGHTDAEAQHQVTLTKDFYLGVFEVTQRQWELVMGTRPSCFNNAKFYQTRPVEQVSYYDIREIPSSGEDPVVADLKNHFEPGVMRSGCHAPEVSWPDNRAVYATSFMGRLRDRTGMATFDLPTEAQWEYACRAGTMTAMNNGKNLTNLWSDANMGDLGRFDFTEPQPTSIGRGGQRGQEQQRSEGVRKPGRRYSDAKRAAACTARAGCFQPNAWGLFDMHGNVWEWCLDWYGTYPGTVNDPKGGSGSARVGRGGSWLLHADGCRSATRLFFSPSDRRDSVGFRVCCDP